MKRRIIQIVVVLLLGAILNVAVAVYCLHAVSLEWFVQQQSMILTGGEKPEYVVAFTKPGHSFVECFPIAQPADFFEGMPDYLEGDQINSIMLQSLDHLPFGWPAKLRRACDGFDEHTEARIEMCGWPFPALTRADSSSFADELAHVNQNSYNGPHTSNMMLLIWQHDSRLDFARPNAPARRLILSMFLPAWPGVAVNTICYAIAIFIVFTLIRFLIANLGRSSARRLIAVVLCDFMLGVSTTIIIAWASAIWDAGLAEPWSGSLWGGRLTNWRADNPGYVNWNVAREDGLTSIHCKAEWEDGDRQPEIFSGMVPSNPAEPLVPYWASVLYPRPGVGAHRHEVEIHGHGWPMCAAWWGKLENGEGGGIPLSPVTLRSAWGVRANVARALPLRPIWIGLCTDALLWSLLWLLLTAASIQLVTLRGRSRQRRGLCAACAYPIGTSSVCTECGKPVRPNPAIESANINQ